MRPKEKTVKNKKRKFKKGKVTLGGVKEFFNKKLKEEQEEEEETIMISEDRDIFDLAPHYEERVSKVLTSEEGVLSNALPGDYIQFMKNVGGGGGHRLIVKDFKVLIEMVPHEQNLKKE